MHLCKFLRHTLELVASHATRREAWTWERHARRCFTP